MFNKRLKINNYLLIFLCYCFQTHFQLKLEFLKQLSTSTLCIDYSQLPMQLTEQEGESVFKMQCAYSNEQGESLVIGH
jgi:hypothetical protein